MEDMDIRLARLESQIMTIEQLITDKEYPGSDTIMSPSNEPQPPQVTSSVLENTPGQHVEEWVSGIEGSHAFVVNEELALSTPCLRVIIGDDVKPLVFSKGIIGGLDEDQQVKYCSLGFEERPATIEQRERLQAMAEAANSCHIATQGVSGTSAHLKEYFGCLGKELKKKGVEP